MLRRIARAVLVLVPMTTCAARLHAHPIEPLDATQELNRCARLVRVAATRKQARTRRHGPRVGALQSLDSTTS